MTGIFSKALRGFGRGLKELGRRIETSPRTTATILGLAGAAVGGVALLKRRGKNQSDKSAKPSEDASPTAPSTPAPAAKGTVDEARVAFQALQKDGAAVALDNTPTPDDTESASTTAEEPTPQTSSNASFRTAFDAFKKPDAASAAAAVKGAAGGLLSTALEEPVGVLKEAGQNALGEVKEAVEDVVEPVKQKAEDLAKLASLVLTSKAKGAVDELKENPQVLQAQKWLNKKKDRGDQEEDLPVLPTPPSV